MATTRLFTAADLAEMPDDGNQYELMRGELIRMPPAGFGHSEVAGELVWHLKNYAKQYGGRATGADGGYLLHVEPDTVFAPDAAYVRAENAPSGTERRRYPRIAPDLVVEVVSPSDRKGRIARKIAEYLAAGVLIVLLVDEDSRTVTVHDAEGNVTVLHEGDAFDGGEVMPDFRLAIAEIFIYSSDSTER